MLALSCAPTVTSSVDTLSMGWRGSGLWTLLWFPNGILVGTSSDTQHISRLTALIYRYVFPLGMKFSQQANQQKKYSKSSDYTLKPARKPA